MAEELGFEAELGLGERSHDGVLEGSRHKKEGQARQARGTLLEGVTDNLCLSNSIRHSCLLGIWMDGK